MTGTRTLSAMLYDDLSVRLGLVVLVASFFLPVHGLGIDVCWVHATTGLPCPGCGLTRSLTNLSHLRFADAWQYHPFGLVIYPLVVALAAGNFIGASRRARVRAWLDARHARFRGVYLAFVAAFLVFGVARLATSLLG